MSVRRSGWVWFSALVTAAGCAGPTLPQDIEAAQALERGGDRDPEALSAWHRIEMDRCAHVEQAKRSGLQPTDPAVDPKDDCGLAGMRQAELLERMGREREAELAWEAAAGRAGSPLHAARAMASAVRLLDGPLGDPDGAAALAWRCVERFPSEVATDDCLAAAVRHDRADPGRAAALRDRLDALARRFEHDDLVDNLRLFAADVTAKELGDVPGAVSRYDALAAAFRRSSLRDDALWRAAILLRAHGDPRGAVDRLERLLATRRRALITGSYNSEYLDDAQLLLGRTWLDDLHDPARAARAFAFLADDFKDSTLRDDALLELSRALLAGGDKAGACRALARIPSEFPDGNQVRAARARAVELGC